MNTWMAMEHFMDTPVGAWLCWFGSGLLALLLIGLFWMLLNAAKGLGSGTRGFNSEDGGACVIVILGGMISLFLVAVAAFLFICFMIFFALNGGVAGLLNLIFRRQNRAN